MPTEAVRLGPALAAQGRVVHALLMRELITRFGRRNFGVLWLVLEPAIFTLAVMALWSLSGLRKSSSLPIAAFAITGYSSVLLWRNIAGHCVNAIHQNQNLLYHRGVRVLDVFAARILLEIGGATASFLLLVFAFVLAEQMPPPEDALQVVAGWLMLCWFGASLGLVLGGATAFGELVGRLWSPLSYVLFPLSGAVFLVESLPPASRDFILLLPMVHGVEMLREGYFGSHMRAYYDVGYAATISLGLTLLGLLLIRVAARRLERR